ncbi:ATP-binding protein [Streptomyces fractus]|uniref:ATP-binding protein n=1 Tax=Streptomyces fractus TaxID=641806 RepID=UPI003CF328DB
MDQHLAQPPTQVRTFRQLLSCTRRDARLARLLAVTELRAWELPSDLTERAELVVAELAANAVLHGHLPGRGFRLALAYDPATRRLRIEVTDTREDCPPKSATPDPTETGGRGLLLVDALADHWDTVPHPPGGKTVYADLSAAAHTRLPF